MSCSATIKFPSPVILNSLFKPLLITNTELCESLEEIQAGEAGVFMAKVFYQMLYIIKYLIKTGGRSLLQQGSGNQSSNKLPELILPTDQDTNIERLKNKYRQLERGRFLLEGLQKYINKQHTSQDANIEELLVEVNKSKQKTLNASYSCASNILKESLSVLATHSKYTKDYTELIQNNIRQEKDTASFLSTYLQNQAMTETNKNMKEMALDRTKFLFSKMKRKLIETIQTSKQKKKVLVSQGTMTHGVIHDFAQENRQFRESIQKIPFRPPKDELKQKESEIALLHQQVYTLKQQLKQATLCLAETKMTIREKDLIIERKSTQLTQTMFNQLGGSTNQTSEEKALQGQGLEDKISINSGSRRRSKIFNKSQLAGLAEEEYMSPRNDVMRGYCSVGPSKPSSVVFGEIIEESEPQYHTPLNRKETKTQRLISPRAFGSEFSSQNVISITIDPGENKKGILRVDKVKTVRIVTQDKESSKRGREVTKTKKLDPSNTSSILSSRKDIGTKSSSRPIARQGLERDVHSSDSKRLIKTMPLRLQKSKKYGEVSESRGQTAKNIEDLSERTSSDQNRTNVSGSNVHNYPKSIKIDESAPKDLTHKRQSVIPQKGEFSQEDLVLFLGEEQALNYQQLHFTSDHKKIRVNRISRSFKNIETNLASLQLNFAKKETQEQTTLTEVTELYYHLKRLKAKNSQLYSQVKGILRQPYTFLKLKENTYTDDQELSPQQLLRAYKRILRLHERCDVMEKEYNYCQHLRGFFAKIGFITESG